MTTAASRANGFRADGFVLFLLGFAAVVADASGARADSGGSDRLALHAIFAEQHAADAALAVHRRALMMDAQQRYDYLSRWVLPGSDHPHLRVSIDFSPLNPAPPVDVKAVAPSAMARTQSGGEIVSPLTDLIAVAIQLNRLREIRQRIDRWSPESDGGESDRLAALLLIDLARHPESASAERLEEFLEQRRGTENRGMVDPMAPSPAEALVFTAGMQHPHLRDVVADAIARYQPWITSEYARSPYKQHVAKLVGAVKTRYRQRAGESWTPMAASTLAQWTPVSRTTSESRGSGYPTARWDRLAGTIHNRGSHDDDYLYFTSPLRGDFDIECDVTAFGWEDSHLMVAGKWVGPVYSLDRYDIGYFRSALPSIPIAPPLTSVHSWLRYRTTVRDLTATTYVNGRIVHQESLSLEHDPWIAIRSNMQCDGAVSNLRIAGTPTVPKQIRLSLDPDLGGWLSYFEDGRYDRLPAMWEHADGSAEGGEIRSVAPDEAATEPLSQQTIGDSDPPPHTTHVGHRENLLRYHRPMLEDGVVEYEFFYLPGRFHTHPAIDRLAFLLDPRGVRIHWVTDGRFDRTGLDPANVYEERANQMTSGSLPLQQNAWNKISLQLIGDLVTLTLNGEPIYQRQLEPTNQRTFGLFHYADATTARVRNVLWTGDWPRQLPGLDQQGLLVDETGFLDRSAEQLQAAFSHNFADDGFPTSKFAVFQGEPGRDVRAAPDGLYATRQGDGGYQHASVAPNLRVGGDFDITASFEKLQTNARPDDAASKIWLGVGTESRDQALLLRWRNVPENDQRLVQCVRNRVIEGEFRSDYFSHKPTECLSGTLRLARRGTDVYYLLAENDSQHFRIIGQETFPADDLSDRGVELTVQSHGKGGSTSVIWKDLAIRAERLSGFALEDPAELLAELNRLRKELPNSYVHDFARRPPDSAILTRWTDLRGWNAQDGGLPIVHDGTDRWTSAGASLLKTISGDFDVTVQFEDVQLADPTAGNETALYLQVEFADAARTQVEAKIRRGPGSEIMAAAQRRDPKDDGGYHYHQLGQVQVNSPQALRLTRRGGYVYYILTSADLGGETIIARTDAPAAPVEPSNIRFVVHTGGAQRTSRVLWKQLAVRADHTGPADGADDSDSPPTPSPATVIPQRFLDLIQ